MPQPYDIQFPDLLGSFYKGKAMARQDQRAPIEDQQNDQMFQYKDQAAKSKVIAQKARFLAGLSPQARPAAYAAMRGELDPIGQSLGLPPLPEAWDETHLGELQQLSMLDQGGDESTPAGLREFQGMTQGLGGEDAEKARRIALGLEARASSALPYAPLKYTDAQGREVVEALDKRTGQSAAPNAVAGLPVASGSDFATEATAIAQKHGFRPTSIARSQSENAKLPGASANSRHLSGNAIDVSIRGKSPQELAALDADMTAAGFTGGIHLEGSFPHMHYSRAPGGPNPYASRPAEQQAGLNAAATENARIGAQVGNTSRVAASEAEIERERARASASGKAEGEREATQAQKAVNAEDSLGLLKEVVKILPSATGSLAGEARDTAGRVIGVSTNGAQAAARLKVLGGILTSKVPRMEGPQSNYDVQSYKEQAGNLADSTLPVATRLAAAKEMIRINEKYAHLNKPQASAPSVIKYDAKGNRLK